MTEEVNAGMGQQAPKKGMSTGCLIAIIVGVVILVFIAGMVYYTISNKDQVMKFGVATLLTSSKQIVVESNIEGIDTVYYNAIIDNFNTQLYADTSMHIENIAKSFENIRLTIEDQKMDGDEVNSLVDALIEIYPDIVPEGYDTEILDSTQSGTL